MVIVAYELQLLLVTSPLVRLARSIARLYLTPDTPNSKVDSINRLRAANYLLFKALVINSTFLVSLQGLMAVDSITAL